MTNVKTVPVFILAGGLGTRLAEETNSRPKPMVEIGEIPMLLHIMRWYYSFGFNDFVICAGYKSWDIKEFFLNYQFRMNHLEIDHRDSLDSPAVGFGRDSVQEKWRVRVVDTGLNAMTGARVARALDVVLAQGQEVSDFALTYGDGLSDIDLLKEWSFHKEHKRVGTVAGVPALSRFGELTIKDSQVRAFAEKPEQALGLINGGFFFFNTKFRDYLESTEECILERKPLEKLAKDGQLMVYQHLGFWHCMDTLRDRQQLQKLWDEKKAAWKPKDERHPK